MSNSFGGEKNLTIFNKEGDSLNILYNNNTEKYEGQLFFDENSSDTFKTISLYAFEKIKGFDFRLASDSSDYLYPKKFQLFNEYDINFISDNSGKSVNLIFTKIEPSNKDIKYYTKWIYGDNFESLFEIGSEIKFNNSITEFVSSNISYTIINKKKGAILIISNTNNKTYIQSYGTTTNNPNNCTISAINAIKVKNYITKQGTYSYTTLKNWNEPLFFKDLFLNQKISVVNSDLNDGVYSINNLDLTDNIYYNYTLPITDLEKSTYLRTDLTYLSENNSIYQDVLVLDGNKIYFNSDIPHNLKNDVKFFVSNSNLNQTIFTVTGIQDHNQLNSYSVDDIVLYHKILYRCVLSYSFSSTIIPTNSTYWLKSNFLYLKEYATPENINNGDIYLFENKISYKDDVGYYNVEDVVYNFINKNKPTFDSLNINLYYDKENKNIKSNLIYPSNYLKVDYIFDTYEEYTGESTSGSLPYLTDIHLTSNPFSDVKLVISGKTYSYSNLTTGDFHFSSTTSNIHTPLDITNVTTSSYLWWNPKHTNKQLLVGDTIKAIWDTKKSNQELEYEKIIGIKESLKTEININRVENLYRELVIKDIDTYGLKVFINAQEYYIETQLVYDDNDINLEKTIDRTIREFVSKYLIVLSDYGISLDIFYHGLNTDLSYINAIRFSTVFPNVPLDIKLLMGSTADYFINDTEVIFYDVNTNVNTKLNITINNINYFILYDTDISTTLTNFVTKYSSILLQYKIDVRSTNNILYIGVKNTAVNITLKVYVGKTTINQDNLYSIINRKPDNKGLILSSNQFRINTDAINDSFENYDFSTAQIVNVQNSYKLNNKEYNILYLDSDRMVFSYQGAFFENKTYSATSGFDLLSFNDGFGYDINGFNLTASTSLTYSSYTYSVGVSSDSAADIIYLNHISEYYIIASTTDNKTKIFVYNAKNDVLKKTILLNIEYIKYHFSQYTEFLYILGNDKYIIYDLTSKSIVKESTTLGSLTLRDISTDVKGNYYIAYTDASDSFVTIYDKKGVLLQTIIVFIGDNTDIRLLYNKVESTTYVFNTNHTYNVRKIDIDGVLSNTTQHIDDIFLNSLYYNYNDNSIIGIGQILFKLKNDTLSFLDDITSDGTYINIITNSYNNDIYVLTEAGIFWVLNTELNIIYTTNISMYGKLILNNFDGNLYITSKNTTDILIYSPYTKDIFLTIPKNYIHNTAIYNYNSRKLIGISDNNIIETFLLDFTMSIEYRSYSHIYQSASVYKDSQGNKLLIDNQDLYGTENSYGALSKEYLDELNSVYNNFTKMTVKDYIRFPRENYNGDVQVKYNWKFVDDIDKSIFIYGTNSNLTKLENKEFTLDYIDSNTDISFMPNPMEIHIGYNSSDEGVNSRTLICNKVEDVKMIVTSNLSVNSMELVNIDDIYGMLKLNVNSTYSFTDFNFKVGQIIKVVVSDTTLDKYNLYISPNDGKTFKISKVSYKELVVDYIDEKIVDENTILSDRNLKYAISVEEKTILEISLFAQTEIEDFRYKIELENTGKLIAPEDTYIFKSYDINEKGIDWNYLNKKRKEMILVRNDIYNYIGSYKAIINAINYFGYNDLTLNEYYLVVDPNSPNYGKKIKIAIPDIFDRSIKGWNDEFFTNLLEKYEETNLFNLSFDITDEDGNNLLYYSIDDVLTKLSGLKNWLQFNVIPLTHKILDITGVSKTKSIHHVKQHSYGVVKFQSNQTITPVMASVTEVYKLPVQSGSSVYNVVIDFKTRNNIIAESFNVEIKTYKTYENWEVFKNYIIDDKVLYYGNLYIALDNNQNKNPLEYNIYPNWDSKLSYRQDDIVLSNDRYYIYQFATADVAYNLFDFKTDLYNKQLGNDIQYLSVVSDSQYSTIDIVNSMFTYNYPATYITYTGNWTTSNKYVAATQVDEGLGLLNILGYQSNMYNSADAILYTFDIINIDPIDVNIFETGIIDIVDTIIFTPTGTISTNVDYGFEILNLDFFPSVTGIFEFILEYEKSPNNFIQICSFVGNTSKNGTYLFNSEISNPKFRMTYKYMSSYVSDMFINLQTMLNIMVSFNFKINESIPLSSYVYRPDLITTDIKNKITDVYYQYAIDNILDNLEPNNLPEAAKFVDNMLLHYSETKKQYKLKYSYLNPTENVLLTDPNFILWNDITIWEKIKLEPVQRITEDRISDMRPLNITIDSNIDPYVVINIITDNGYGHSYKFEKSYEIKYNADLLQ